MRTTVFSHVNGDKRQDDVVTIRFSVDGRVYRVSIGYQHYLSHPALPLRGARSLKAVDKTLPHDKGSMTPGPVNTTTQCTYPAA